MEGIIYFQETKEYLANLFLFLKEVVTVGSSTEDSREGVFMTFLFDITKQPLSLSARGIVSATCPLKIIALRHSLESVVSLRYCEVTGQCREETFVLSKRLDYVHPLTWNFQGRRL